MNKYFVITLLVLFIGCKNKTKEHQETNPLNTETTSEIKITQPIIVQDSLILLLEDKENLVKEFLTFWNKYSFSNPLDYSEFHISIDEALDTIVNQSHYIYFKYRIVGLVGCKAEAYKVCVYHEQNNKYERIYQTSINMKDCDVEDYFLKSIDESFIKENEFVVLTMHTRIWGCSGATDRLIDTLVFIKKPEFNFIGKIEFNYVDWNNYKTSGNRDTIYRKSRLNLMSDTAILTTTSYQGFISDSSEVITKYLVIDENGIKEITN